MATLTLANGTVYEIDEIRPAAEFFKGDMRDAIHIQFIPSITTYEEICNLMNTPEVFEHLVFTYQEPADPDTTTSYDYYGYTIPVGIVTHTANHSGEQISILKLATLSETEAKQNGLENDNIDVQMALIELGDLLAAMEERIGLLEETVAALSTTSDEEG